MKRTAKLLAVVLAALLLMTGCQTDTTWVYTYGEGKTMPAGVYIYFMMNSFDEAFSKLYQLETEAYLASLNAAEEAEASGGEAPEAESTKSVYEMNYKEVLAQPLEGTTAAEWTSQNAQKIARRYMATEQKLEELGVSLTEEETAIQRNNASQIFKMSSYSREEDGTVVSGEKFFTSRGVSENSLFLASQLSRKMTLLFEALYGKGGEYEVPENEVVTYFKENYIRGQQLVMEKPTLDDLPGLITEEDRELTEEEQAIADMLTENNEAQLATMQAELKTLADKLAKDIEGGASIEDVTWEYDKYHSGEDTDRNPDGSLDFIVLNDDYSEYGQDVVDGLNTLGEGESTLLDTEQYYIIIRRLDLMEKPEDLEEHRLGVLIDLRYNDVFLPLLDEWGAALPVTANDAAIKRYTADRLR